MEKYMRHVDLCGEKIFHGNKESNLGIILSTAFLLKQRTGNSDEVVSV